jgi:hypothetical protein
MFAFYKHEDELFFVLVVVGILYINLSNVS